MATDSRVMCCECEDVPAAFTCSGCGGDALCGLCFRYLHRRGARAAHSPTPLPGVDMAQHLEPRLVAGTTEHFTESFRPRPAKQPLSSSQEDSSSAAAADSTVAPTTAKSEESGAVEQARWVPMRLREEERAMMQILEGVLDVSEYTDHVDVSFDYFGWRTGGMDKARIIDEQLTEVLHLVCGLCIAGDYQRGRRVLERELRENEAFFQTVFEVGRRYKIMNPDRMRTSYGKLMHIMQDCVQSRSVALHEVRPVLTVRGFLNARGALELLDDPDLARATAAIVEHGSPTAAVEKAAAQKAIVARHAGEGKPLSEEDAQLALDSLSDANAYLVANRDPVDRMLDLLQKIFPATDPSDKESKAAGGPLSLSINYGQGGSCLTHSHTQQYEFVRQSLTLWREIQHNMFKLWLLADRDLLSSSGYRLVNTGQGLNRMQAAPNISSAMSSILGKVQASLGRGWLGLSVVHLGDYDVPNALVFIDKYSQVPRILAPIVRVIDRIEVLAKDPRVSQLVENCGGVAFCKRFILRDFFRHGFDGSGSDGGSCVDGRLTSAWNWTEKIASKAYYPLFLATGFQSFDGNWS